MASLLPIDWYITPPYDLEYKHYCLLDYTQKCDRAFKRYQLSPWLLWTEAMYQDIVLFLTNTELFKEAITQERLSITNGHLSLQKHTPALPSEVDLIIKLAQFAAPILNQKIELGNQLLQIKPQVLH